MLSMLTPFEEIVAFRYSVKRLLIIGFCQTTKCTIINTKKKNSFYIKALEAVSISTDLVSRPYEFFSFCTNTEL